MNFGQKVIKKRGDRRGCCRGETWTRGNHRRLNAEQGQRWQKAKLLTKLQGWQDPGDVQREDGFRRIEQKIIEAELGNGARGLSHIDGINEDDPPRPFDQGQQGHASGTAINNLDPFRQFQISQPFDDGNSEAVVPHQRVADTDDTDFRQNEPATGESNN